MPKSYADEMRLDLFAKHANYSVEEQDEIIKHQVFYSDSQAIVPITLFKHKVNVVNLMLDIDSLDTYLDPKSHQYFYTNSFDPMSRQFHSFRDNSVIRIGSDYQADLPDLVQDPVEYNLETLTSSDEIKSQFLQSQPLPSLEIDVFKSLLDRFGKDFEAIAQEVSH